MDTMADDFQRLYALEQEAHAKTRERLRLVLNERNEWRERAAILQMRLELDRGKGVGSGEPGIEARRKKGGKKARMEKGNAAGSGGTAGKERDHGEGPATEL